ncbi:hypothetical protein [Pseudonocardia sp.]|uniref:hypothetical protein n=1 Tax=Pseudonocardia sp. TaxID=60912 RepID=UPI002617C68C|nr:hypothetical protein [Pseudonocardia sp.]
MTDGGAGLRGCALALLSALLTAAGHAAGGGTLPDLALLVLLLPLLGAVFVALADRASGPLGVVAVLAGGQLALHHLMVLLHPAHHAEPALLGPAAMLATHAAATVVVAVAVRYADAAIAVVGSALRRALPRRPASRPAERPLPAPVPAAGAAGRRLAGALAAARVRRGPPAWA